MIPSISYKKSRVSKTSALWISLLFTLSLAVVILFVFDIPQKIQKELNDHVVHKKLENTRQSLLRMKALLLSSEINQSRFTLESKIEQLDKHTNASIRDYETAATHSGMLTKTFADFKLAYNKWVAVEKIYLTQLLHSRGETFNHDGDHNLAAIASENNLLFLDAMQLLFYAEESMSEDLELAHQSFQVLQAVSLFVIICFLIVAIFYQRSSTRKHMIREKNLEVTLRSIADAVIATDIHGNITCMNPEAERLTGWDFKDANGSALSKVLRIKSEFGGEHAENLIERVKHGKNVVVYPEDSILITLNGNRYHIHESGAPIYDDSGTIIGVVLVFTDITQEHDLKNQLNDHVKRMQGVIDTSMDCLIVIDELGMVKEWNPAAELIFGWSYEEISKLTVQETIIPEEFRERHLSGIKRLINNKQSSAKAKRIESIAMHRDGHRFPIELAMTAICTENGWVFNSFIRDLTDKKNNENIIKKKDGLLRDTQRAAKLGYWELDLVDDTLEWSDEIYRIFGLDPDISEPSYELFINTVHPDDREQVDTAYSASVKHKTPYNIVHRVLSSGGVKVVHEQGETRYDDDGQPVRSLGLVQDITERVNNLEELRLAATMFNVQTGILVTTTDGTITRVNPAFERVTGYSSSELVGSNPRMLQSGKHNKEFYRDMWNSIVNDEMWQGELWNKRKDGELYAEWLTITAVKNDIGEVLHYVGTSQDITKRKQAESKIE